MKFMNEIIYSNGVLDIIIFAIVKLRNIAPTIMKITAEIQQQTEKIL